jgi:GNAT superfamily N-acetyltransferase
MEFTIRPIKEADRNWIPRFVREQWGAEFVVAHGVVYYPHELQGYVAEIDQKNFLGLATFVIENSACELVTLNSVHQGQGIGTGLVQAVAQRAVLAGCSRMWCITTNDNLPALEFYQKRGFRIIAVHAGAVERSRELKPSIPILGIDGIPIRDEIELELQLHTNSNGPVMITNAGKPA